MDLLATVRTWSSYGLSAFITDLTPYTMVPPNDLKWHELFYDIEPTVCNCEEGHSLKTPAIKLICTFPDVSEVCLKGFFPIFVYLGHYFIKAFRLKSLNIAIWPFYIRIYNNRKSVSAPSGNFLLEYPEQHSQLKTTQSGSNLLIWEKRLLTYSVSYYSFSKPLIRVDM